MKWANLESEGQEAGFQTKVAVDEVCLLQEEKSRVELACPLGQSAPVRDELSQLDRDIFQQDTEGILEETHSPQPLDVSVCESRDWN